MMINLTSHKHCPPLHKLLLYVRLVSDQYQKLAVSPSINVRWPGEVSCLYKLKVLTLLSSLLPHVFTWHWIDSSICSIAQHLRPPELCDTERRSTGQYVFAPDVHGVAVLSEVWSRCRGNAPPDSVTTSWSSRCCWHQRRSSGVKVGSLAPLRSVCWDKQSAGRRRRRKKKLYSETHRPLQVIPLCPLHSGFMHLWKKKNIFAPECSLFLLLFLRLVQSAVSG